jgi:hypothetical protein
MTHRSSEIPSPIEQAFEEVIGVLNAAVSVAARNHKLNERELRTTLAHCLFNMSLHDLARQLRAPQEREEPEA